jgi:hypothetical protein
LYGVHGIGKSSWAAQAPGVLMMDLEDGLADIDCSRTEPIKDLLHVRQVLEWLRSEKHDFRTLAIDSADWLEQLVHKDVAESANKQSIGDIPYNAGYKTAEAIWRTILNQLNMLRDDRGMAVIFTAHSTISRFTNPAGDSYDRYEPALHKSSSALIQQWADEVFFASYRVSLQKKDEGFGKQRAVAVGGEERYVRTQEHATAYAKNRLRMPAEIGFSFDEYRQAITASRQTVKKEEQE